MKKILCLLVLAIVLSSCHSSKQMLPPTPVIVNNTDSVRIEYVETVRIDTIAIEVKVPAETVTRIAPDSASRIETSLAVSEAWINPDGTIGHTLAHKDASIPAEVIVPAKDTQIYHQAVTMKEVPVPYPEPVYVERNLTWWEKVRINAFWYLLGLTLVSIGWCFRKNVFSIIMKCFN